MIKRAAIYARVSTDIQRDNYSIPSQVGECLTYIENRGYKLSGDQFIDATTGKDVAEDFPHAIPAFVDDFTSRELSRPSLDAALRYLERHGFDILVVHALDRLARDPYIRQTLEREFRNRGARVEFVLGAYDESPEGEVRKDLDATFAKWENAKRVERSLRGKHRKAQSGKWVHGTPPYGYRIEDSCKGGLAVVPEQAEVVRLIFELYTEKRSSLTDILAFLTRNGYSPQRGTHWAKSTVNHILDNTIYAGYFFFNKTRREGNRDIYKDHKEWIRIESTPIIDQVTYDKAQLRRADNQAYFRKLPKHKYLLHGLVVCSKCARAYVAQTFRFSYYRHRKSAGHCMNKQISARILEKVVWDKVLDLLLHPDSLEAGYAASIEQYKNSMARKTAQLDILQQGLAKIKEKKQNLTSAYLDPDIQMSKVDFMEQKTRIEEEERALEDNLAQLRNDLAQAAMPADIDTLKKFSSEISRGLLPVKKLSIEKKREVLEQLHTKVIFHPDGQVELDGWFNVPSQQTGLLSGSSSCRGSRWCNPHRLRR